MSKMKALQLKKYINKIFRVIKREIQDPVKGVEFCSNKIYVFKMIKNNLKLKIKHLKSNNNHIKAL